jgi:transposase InsO family protein
MPRCPARDYADRCAAIELQQRGLRQCQIAATLQRPVRWVRRTMGRYDAAVGVASLCDHSSRPQRSPQRAPPEIEVATCALKQTHMAWGRRQIAKQLRWQWRDQPERQCWVSVGRVRRVLARHPELTPPMPAPERTPPRQIDYLTCNLLWAADIHETHLPDGSVWYTLHWLDLHSRFELGQLTTQHLTEELVVDSFLEVARQYGLPQIVKSDHDKLWYDGVSGLPSRLTRVLSALGVYHLLVGPKQPWWNGVVERYVRTCRQEVVLPPPEEGAALPQAIETARLFYNEQRCHSRCQDQPPATRYHASARRIPPGFDPTQAPFTQEPLVLARQVQAGGRISLAGRTFPFSPQYAQQTISVTVTGWFAVGQAADGWQRTWDLHDHAVPPPTPPPSPTPPQPLTRKVDRDGCVTLSNYRYYVGSAWAGQTLTIQRNSDAWSVSLPDGSQKTLPCKHLYPQPPARAKLLRPSAPMASLSTEPNLQTRRVNQNGQVAFHNRLYFVGIAQKGQTIAVVPTSAGLEIYNTQQAWITTCPWKQLPKPDKPLCPM